MQHYRCYKVWVNETRSTRITDTLEWFPTTVHIPQATTVDIISAKLEDIKGLLKQAAPVNLPNAPNIADTITELDALLHQQPQHPSDTPPLRVKKSVRSPTSEGGTDAANHSIHGTTNATGDQPCYA